MCAKHTDNEFEEMTARNYNKLSKTTTKVSYFTLVSTEALMVEI